jgi:hypothetical protein
MSSEGTRPAGRLTRAPTIGHVEGVRRVPVGRLHPRGRRVAGLRRRVLSVSARVDRPRWSERRRQDDAARARRRTARARQGAHRRRRPRPLLPAARRRAVGRRPRDLGVERRGGVPLAGQARRRFGVDRKVADAQPRGAQARRDCGGALAHARDPRHRRADQPPRCGSARRARRIADLVPRRWPHREPRSRPARSPVLAVRRRRARAGAALVRRLLARDGRGPSRPRRGAPRTRARRRCRQTRGGGRVPATARGRRGRCPAVGTWVGARGRRWAQPRRPRPRVRQGRPRGAPHGAARRA